MDLESEIKYDYKKVYILMETCNSVLKTLKIMKNAIHC